MTQKNKDLLLKDLCARLPYGIKAEIKYYDNVWELLAIYTNGTTYVTRDVGYPIETYFDHCKPYLFPLSSMTEEQKEELCILCDWHDDKNDAKSILVLYQGQFVMNTDVIDWFHKNHIDWRGLIPKGLALDATGLNIY